MLRLHKNEYQFEHPPGAYNINQSDLINYDQNTNLYEYKLTHLISQHENIYPDQIMFTSGGLGGIEFIVSHLLDNKTNTIHFTTPTYSSFENYVKHKYSDRYVSKQIYFDKTTTPFIFDIKPNDVVYICNPNNPTGTVWDNNDIIKFMALNPDVKIILDEVYIDYANFKSMTFNTPIYKNLYIIKSFSKSYGLAGIRLGYIVSDKSNIMHIKTLYNTHHVTDLARAHGIRVYENIEYYRKQIYIHNNVRSYLCHTLSEHKIINVECQTNFILIYIGENINKLIDIWEKENIYVRNMLVYGFSGWIRITVPQVPFIDKILTNKHLIDTKPPLEWHFQNVYRMKELVQLTQVAIKILNDNKIPYWISDGTLLGYVRNKEILKWDDDVDLSMLETDIPLLLELESSFADVGLLLCKNRFGVYWQIRKQINVPIEEYYKSPEYKEDPNIDIFIYRTKDDILINTDERFTVDPNRKQDALAYMNMTYDDVFPLKKSHINNICVNIPQRSKKIIDTSVPGHDEFIRIKQGESFLEYTRI